MSQTHVYRFRIIKSDVNQPNNITQLIIEDRVDNIIKTYHVNVLFYDRDMLFKFSPEDIAQIAFIAGDEYRQRVVSLT